MFCVIIYFLLLANVDASNSTEAQKLEQANNQFAASIYAELSASNSSNIIVSPLSASTILTLLYFGCNGESARQLRETLYLPRNPKITKIGERDLISQLPKSSEGFELNLANKVYVSSNFTIENSFTKLASDIFQAETQNLDFCQPDQAANTINQWVTNQTRGIINNLIDPRALSAATAVVLVNALYLKANWSLQFSTTDTQKEVFTVTSKKTVEADFMHLRGKQLNYYSCHILKAQFLELPFLQNESSVIFALPNAKDGLPVLERQIRTVLLLDLPLKATLLNVALPKFKFGETINFQQILRQLGVTDIFERNEADLSGISGNRSGLVVSNVVQKAAIDLNEGGVEAAAATYIGVSITAVVKPLPINFVADHPFIFWIKVKGAIAFVGRVVEPKY